MADFESNHPERHVPYKKKLKTHTFVKDHDLQIHIPTIKDANLSRRALRFKVPYEFMLQGCECTQLEGNSGPRSQEKDIKQAMEEAETSFDSMMQIRSQLHRAYQEFMQMKS